MTFQDAKIIDNGLKLENKKQFKRQHYHKFPEIDSDLLGLINPILLQNAIFYAKNILNNINSSCEGDEFFKQNHIKPVFKIPQQT